MFFPVSGNTSIWSHLIKIPSFLCRNDKGNQNVFKEGYFQRKSEPSVAEDEQLKNNSN